MIVVVIIMIIFLFFCYADYYYDDVIVKAEFVSCDMHCTETTSYHLICTMPRFYRDLPIYR